MVDVRQLTPLTICSLQHNTDKLKTVLSSVNSVPNKYYIKNNLQYLFKKYTHWWIFGENIADMALVLGLSTVAAIQNMALLSGLKGGADGTDWGFSTSTPKHKHLIGQLILKNHQLMIQLK